MNDLTILSFNALMFLSIIVFHFYYQNKVKSCYRKLAEDGYADIWDDGYIVIGFNYRERLLAIGEIDNPKIFNVERVVNLRLLKGRNQFYVKVELDIPYDAAHEMQLFKKVLPSAERFAKIQECFIKQIA